MEKATKKPLTGSQVLSEKITLGGCEEKQSGRYRYLKTQVIYDEQPFLLKERGNLKIFSFQGKSFSVGLSVTNDNKIYFEAIEKKLNELYDNLPFKLIKPTHDYLKVFIKLLSRNGKIHTPVRILEGGKKKLANPMDYLGIPFRGQVYFKISHIYDGNCVSLICEAQEVLIEDIFPSPQFLRNILMLRILINFSIEEKLLKFFVVFFQNFFWNRIQISKITINQIHFKNKIIS